jgi:hypothetical protein
MNNIPNWQKNSGKIKKTKGVCKARLKARKQALKSLLNKINHLK